MEKGKCPVMWRRARLSIASVIGCLASFSILHSPFSISFAAVVTPPLASTAYTRQLLTNSTAAGARAKLEITESNTWFAGWDSYTNAASTYARSFTTNEWATNLAYTVYVATNGSDSWPGTMLFPYRTLGKAVTNAPNSSKIVLRPGDYPQYGAYHLNPTGGDGKANVNLINRTNLWIDGGESARITGTNLLSAINVNGCSNILFTGFTVWNDKAAGSNDVEWLSASNKLVTVGIFGFISVSDSTDIHLRRVNMAGSYDHGLLVDPYGTATFETTNNCSVMDCQAERMGLWREGGGSWWDGAGFVTGAGWTAIRCRTYDASACVEVYPYATTKQLPAAIITGCEAVNSRGAGFSVDRCAAVMVGNSAWNGDMSGWVVGAESAGILVRGAANRSTIQANVIDNCQYGIWFSGANTNTTVVGNTFSRGLDGVAITGDTDGLYCAGNTFFGQTRLGIQVHGTLVNSVFDGGVWRQSGTNNLFGAAFYAFLSTLSNVTFRGTTIANNPGNTLGLKIETSATALAMRLLDNDWSTAATAHNVAAPLEERALSGTRLTTYTDGAGITNVVLVGSLGNIGLAFGDRATPGAGVALQPGDAGATLDIADAFTGSSSLANIRAANGYLSGTLNATTAVVTPSITLGTPGVTRTTWPASGGGDVYAASNNVFTGRNTFTNTVSASNLWDRSNVKWWGATGDGVTDDTVAIQNALNGGRAFFPAGTYICTNLVLTTNAVMSGEGADSILRYKDGAGGWLISENTNTLIAFDIKCDGGNSAWTPATNGLRNGILLTGQKGSTLERVLVTGFDNAGVGFMAFSNEDTAPAINDCRIRLCYTGIDTAISNAPTGYARIVGNGITGCHTGIDLKSGNTTITGNTITENYTGVRITDIDGNGGHGTITGNLINHNLPYVVYASNIVHGFSVVGNELWYGDIWLDKCTGMHWSGNGVCATNIVAINGFRNRFGPNEMFQVHPNYLQTNDTTIFIDNTDATGTYADKSLAVDTNVVYTGATGLLLTNKLTLDAGDGEWCKLNSRYGNNWLGFYGAGSIWAYLGMSAGAGALMEGAVANSFVFGGANSAITYHIGNSAANGITVATSGNFGVGTNSPQAKLHVVGNGGTSNLLQMGLTNADMRFNIDTNGTPWVRGTNLFDLAAAGGAGGSATNAIAAVSINGTNLVAAGATNLNLIQGPGVTLIGTNDPAGQANIYFTSTGSTNMSDSGFTVVLTGSLQASNRVSATNVHAKDFVGTDYMTRGNIVFSNDVTSTPWFLGNAGGTSIILSNSDGVYLTIDKYTISRNSTNSYGSNVFYMGYQVSNVVAAATNFGSITANTIDATNATFGTFTATNRAIPVKELAGVGTSNTNFIFSALEDLIYVNAGRTNVSVISITNWSASLAYRGSIVFTNRSSPSANCTLTLGNTINNWINLQQFDGIAAPFTVTNSQAGRLSWEILGTNVQYSYKPMALPSN